MKKYLPPLSVSNASPMECGGNLFQCFMDKEGEKFSDYVEHEKKHFSQQRKCFRDLQSVIYDEISGMFCSDLKSAPIFYSGYTYEFIYDDARALYSLYQNSTADHKARLVIDFNDLVAEDSYFSLHGWLPNNTHDQILFWVDISGNERCQLWLKDVLHDKLIHIAEDVGGAAWNMNDGILFTRLDDKNRAHKVYSLDGVHRDDEFNRPVEIWVEDNERFDLYVSNNRQRDLLYITASSLDCNEIYYAKAGGGLCWNILGSRRYQVKYQTASLDNHFLISVTADGIKSLYLKNKTAPYHLWNINTGHEYDEILEMHAFKRFILLVIKFRAEIRLIVSEIAQPLIRNSQMEFKEIPLLDKASIISLACNKTYDPSEIYISYESHLRPESLIKITPDIHFKYYCQETIQLNNFVNYSPHEYCSDRLWITSFDGEKIPVTLLRKESTKTSSPRPVVLYAYGAYGFSIEPYFSPARIPLLERGYVFAIAHVRGGGELGNDWHRAAKKMTKKVSINDFIACAQGLIELGITRPKEIAIWGESAGGTLMAAALNDHPELFGAAVLDVPFVDVIGNLSNTALPETIQEWDEWGSPYNSDELKAMQAYCPMANIKSQTYPAILTLVSLNDVHIPYWEPIIWSLNIRHSNWPNNMVMIKIEENSSHLGSDNIDEYIERSALIISFIINNT